MSIEYKQIKEIRAEDLSQLFARSGIRRPYEDLDRMQKMIDNADIILTAWDGGKLVGIARALTDHCYCCYLSDLAVDHAYQKTGIGKTLVQLLRDQLGEEVTLLLLSAPEAVEYYPKIGFTQTDKGFVITRKK